MIPYTYEVIESSAQGCVFLFHSPGYPDMQIGAHAPREGESIDSLASMYAPIANWLERDVVRVVVPVGTTGSFTPPEPEPVTLDTTKRDKLAEIAAWRYAQETGGIIVGGSRIRTDRESQATIVSAFTSLKEGLITTVDWKTATGAFITLGPAEISGVAQAVAMHVQACFSAEALLVGEVKNAQTIEAVQAIQPPDLVA